MTSPFPLDSFFAPSRQFFSRDVLEVSPELLGAVLIRSTDEGDVGIRITEVEAYAGERDPGAHSFRGKTARNQTMFGQPGHIYCYFNYGLHHAINLVCGLEGQPYGCLIRAGEVILGHDLARNRREVKPRKHPLPEAGLARGPGNVAQSFGVNLNNDGDDLFSDAAFEGRWSFLLPASSGEDLNADLNGELNGDGDLNVEPRQIFTGPRIGVNGPGGDAERFPWRFWLPNEVTVSATRKPKL